VIKKLAEREGKLYLSSVNPMYEDQPFPEDAKIWGPVIAIIRNLTNGYPGTGLTRPPPAPVTEGSNPGSACLR
jgi:hypothetical protein